MNKIVINRDSWHYRFIKRFVTVYDENLTDTCAYTWAFIKGVVSLTIIAAFFIFIGGLIAYFISGTVYSLYLLCIGVTTLPEWALGAFSAFALIVIAAIVLLSVKGLIHVFKKAKQTTKNLEHSESSAGQVYKSFKNKTCSYIEFK